MVTGVVPHVGGPILPPGEPKTLIAGLPAARLGDMAVCAGGPDVIAMGSFTVLIGGKPAARLGDMTAHGGSIVVGCPTVLIGDSGGGAGSPAGFTMSAAKASGAAFTQTKCVSDGVQETADAAFASAQGDESKSSWIEIELRDGDGAPVPFVRYRVIPPDERIREGTLDHNGFARVGGIDPGQCKILFPDLDGRSWAPADAGAAGLLVAPGSDEPLPTPIDPPAPPPVPPAPIPIDPDEPGPVPPPVVAAPPSIRGETIALRTVGGPTIRPASIALRVVAAPAIRPGSVSLRVVAAPSIRSQSVTFKLVASPSIRPQSVTLKKK
jgi:uncharacterized Zn-binding protein involved in type VI secretion